VSDETAAPLAWWRRRLSPLWGEKPFRRMWFADTISMLGSQVSGFAIPVVAVVTLGASTGQMGLMQALHGIPILFFGLLAGVWVDRVNVRRLLINLDFIAAALISAVPIGYLLGFLSMPMLYALEFGWGFLSPFWWPAYNRFLPQTVHRDQLVEANSKVSFSVSATGAVGPTLAGALVQALKAPFAVLVDTASFLIAAALYTRIDTTSPAAPADAEPATTFASMREGLRTVFLDPLQRSLTIPRAILDVVDATSLAVYFIYVIRLVGLTPGVLGTTFSLVSVGFVMGSLFAPRVERRVGAGRTALLGLAMVGASPYTMLLADRSHPTWLNVLFLVIPGLLGGSGGIIQYIAFNSIRQAITPQRMLGRVFATTGTLRGLLSIGGALLGGYLGGRIGLRQTIAVVCVGYAVPFVYALVAPFRTVTISHGGHHPIPIEDVSEPPVGPPLAPPPPPTPS
jgi:MFS family permease